MSLDIYLSCPCCEHEVFSANITHNLNRMAAAAGIYDYLWRGDEHGISFAAQLVSPLKTGIEQMKAQPLHFIGFESSNGWGRYENFVPWLERLLEACERNPYAKVSVSR